MKASGIILAFESSCDDTSVALITTDYKVIIQLTSTQIEHIKYGGVLPELASRLHMKNILFLVESALYQSKLGFHDLSAIAVSINPGLIGSLIVGLSFAKSLAWSLSIPLITVNHMLGHVYANHISHDYLSPPYLALIVSGGHTEMVHFSSDTEFSYVGKTRDDAAGETFDKVAKLLKLGFPGGPIIDKIAASGNPDFHVFPRAIKQKDSYDFSYSGLKTSVKQYIASQTEEWVNAHINDVAASIQKAIIEPLVTKSIRYAVKNNIRQILICGGVAANSLLRNMLTEKADKYGIKVYYPTLSLCMDNASMIGAAAIPKLLNSHYSNLEVNAFSDKGIRYL